MISSKLVNIFFSGLAGYVNRLFGGKIEAPNKFKRYEEIDEDKIKENFDVIINSIPISLKGDLLTFLDPGKIYCISINSELSIEDIKSVIEELRKISEKLDLKFMTILDGTMKFVSIPKGYEIVKKDNKK